MTTEEWLTLALAAGVPLAAGRVQPVTRAQGTAFPSLTYSRVSTVTGRTQTEEGPHRPRFQVSCWGLRYSDTQTLARQVAHAVIPIGGEYAGQTDLPYEPESKVYHTAVEVLLWDRGN